MAAKVEIIYEAEATSLKATVNEVTKANDEMVKGAQESAKEIQNAYKGAINNATKVLQGDFLKKAISGQVTLVQSLGKAGAALKPLANSLDETSKKLKIVVQSEDDVKKLEDRLRKLSLEGKRNTEEFQTIAQAVGEYKSAIIAADRAVDLYAKQTDAATGRIGELEDKLYDLALAGQTNSQEFKDLVKEVAVFKRAIVETDAQVDALTQRGSQLTGFVQSVELVGSAFQAVEGAAALFGAENEELQKTLLRLQAITAITSALEQGRAIITEQLAKKTGIATAAQTAYNVVVGQSTGLLKGIRIALAATGIGLFVVGLVALVENFDKVKRALENSIPGFKTVSNAIGDVVDTIKEWVGASGDAERAGAAFDAAAKKQNDATKAIVDSYNRRIAVEQAAGRNTTQLELEREQAVIDANKKILKDYQLASTEIIKLNAEQKQAAIDTATAAKDAVDESENNILVIRAESAKKAADIAAENAKAIAKAQIDTFRNLQNETAKLQSDFDNKAAEDRKNSEKKLQVELTDLADTSLQTQLDTRLAFLQRLEIEEGSSLDRRINIIELEAKIRQANIKEQVSDVKKANELIALDEAQTQQKIREERKKSNDEAIDQAFEIAQAVAGTLGSIIELQGIQAEKRIEAINAASEQEKLAIERSTASEADKQRKLDALRLRTEQKVAAEKRRQAVAEKAQAIFEATIGTAVAVANAKTPVLKALAVASGIAQIAIIASTPIPKFKKGGAVGGRSHEAGGTLIEAERGEFVVNKNSAGRHRTELDALNRSSAAFRKLIDERYVRPAILSYASKRKDGITVNASLNSKSMERELKGLRKDINKQRTVVNINGLDSRYSWHQN